MGRRRRCPPGNAGFPSRVLNNGKGIFLGQSETKHEEYIGKVLIADDDPDFRRLLVRRARKMGLYVVDVEDGDKAVEALTEGDFDVLVVDLYMPGCTGLDVIRDAQKANHDLEAIILTGSATFDTAIQALRAGVYDYLTKPLESLTVFEITLSRALERRYLIKENQRLFNEIQRLAMTDQLTGLYNRRKLMDGLEIEVQRVHRYGRPLSLIMIDLDNLKGINDTFGHAAGDAALQLIADAIQEHIRRVDLPARVGGDEFMILLPEAEIETATLVAKRVCAKITDTLFQDTKISVSVGIGQWIPEYQSAAGFLHAVDQALYQAKRAGRMRIIVCTPEGSVVTEADL
jgi:two-component system cell cycle response regulator